ncbi:MAG: 5-(carboxyamino)imidazole ribonucleotide synthase [Alphaproteobacteria bacterium GM7ARS4]|nr:5-(carboxyamino)imidazole ribonucleotide synthase [Alphaproteobacteria bacterium GM7ARS4]
MLAQGSWIGIVGGGQLGMMLAVEARKAGYRVYLFCDDQDAPALSHADRYRIADYGDGEALMAFARFCSVVTCEFEHIPIASLRHIERYGCLRPSSHVFFIAQHRAREKRFIDSHSLPVAPWCEVRCGSGIMEAIRHVGLPCLLKTCALGYDGRGQRMLRTMDDVKDVSSSLSGDDIVEKKIAYVMEFSIIACRSLSGVVCCYDVARNEHKGGILHRSIVPVGSCSLFPDEVRQRAEHMAVHLIERLDVVGLLAVEFFLTSDGEIIINEVAPRAHNSGHWTMDGSKTSQFAQWVRMISGGDSGDISRTHKVEMYNLLGDDVHRYEGKRSSSRERVHLYGKKCVRAGRKMGHVNILSSDVRTM